MLSTKPAYSSAELAISIAEDQCDSEMACDKTPRLRDVVIMWFAIACFGVYLGCFTLSHMPNSPSAGRIAPVFWDKAKSYSANTYLNS